MEANGALQRSNKKCLWPECLVEAAARDCKHFKGFKRFRGLWRQTAGGSKLPRSIEAFEAKKNKFHTCGGPRRRPCLCEGRGRRIIGPNSILLCNIAADQASQRFLQCIATDLRFKCERPVSLGMNIDSLTKILKMTGTNDSLKIRYQNDADTVNFQCEGSDDRLADFDLKLMTIESEHMEIPEQHYKVVARIPSAEFQKICRDLKEFGETIQISGSKEGLKFMVQGDLGSGNVVLKPREGEKPEEKVTLTVHEPVTATFALRYLVNFSKDT